MFTVVANRIGSFPITVASITDAFCRVSGGKSEAFIVKGYSGSGKTRLVDSLTARIDIAEGYVLKHKFSQMSKENQLLEVLALLDSLCLLICEKRTQREVESLSVKLTELFGSEIKFLAQLLPNLGKLAPQIETITKREVDNQTSNLHSTCFLLRRFMAVVSSSLHPVVLFFDDLQWSDTSSLAVVEEMLTGPAGCCLFFVGTCRDNEISADHALFDFMHAVSSAGVPTTTLSLSGLKPRDLNTIISDALCIFPRICETLSDIVFQKTNGAPFFALSFLKSLADNKLLEYCHSKRRWVWDKDQISSMDITDNVLHLFTSKMGRLSQDAQLALKVVACFGTKTRDCLLGYLAATSQFGNIRNGLKLIHGEGFLVRVDSDWKWVHDKVREAAYSLIQASEKKEVRLSSYQWFVIFVTRTDQRGEHSTYFLSDENLVSLPHWHGVVYNHKRKLH